VLIAKKLFLDLVKEMLISDSIDEMPQNAGSEAKRVQNMQLSLKT